MSTINYKIHVPFIRSGYVLFVAVCDQGQPTETVLIFDVCFRVYRIRTS